MPTCENCTREFNAKRADAAFCSDACRKAHKRNSADNGANSPDKVSAIITPDNPDALEAEANRLVAAQREHRGTVDGPVIDGRKTTIMGPYLATAETEERAGRIIALRRRAGNLRAQRRIAA